jgi:hypothetical protein
MDDTTTARDSVRGWARLGRVLLGGLPLSVALWLFAGWLAVEYVTSSRRSQIAPLASLGGVPLVDVSTTTEDGIAVPGWLVRAAERRVVIVLSGHGGNRASNLGPAELYVSRGWSVLLPDLRASSESGGQRSGLGLLERSDVRAWIELARRSGFTEMPASYDPSTAWAPSRRPA